MKKNIPLLILQNLVDDIPRILDLTNIESNENLIFQLKDKDKDSKFYFKLLKQELKNGTLNYLIEYNPKDKENKNTHSEFLNLENTLIKLRDWIDILQAYEETLSFFEDPIVKTNQKRFENEFQIIDDDSEISSFDLKQQLYLEEYLLSVKLKLENFKEGRSENEVIELEELIAEANEIESRLTKETKKQIMKKLSFFWAKAQKHGLYIIKEILIDFAVDFLKKNLING